MPTQLDKHINRVGIRENSPTNLHKFAIPNQRYLNHSSCFQGMYSIISVGNAMYSVSTYGRAHNAAMRLGFNDDIDTYLLISSKHSFAEMIHSILIINFCEVLGQVLSSLETLLVHQWLDLQCNILDLQSLQMVL